MDEISEALVEECGVALAESYRTRSVSFKAWFEMPEGLKINLRHDIRVVIGTINRRKSVALVVVN